MSTDYRLVCYTCKEEGPLHSSGSSAYGYKVWNDTETLKWLGHQQAIGNHEGHDLRIVSEHVELPWEPDDE